MSIPSNWVMFLMFKPLILSNIAICWGAFPWFSMVLEIPSFPPRQRQAPKVFLLLCTADPYHLPGSLPGPGSPYPLRSRASPPHLPVPILPVSSPSSVHRQLPGSRQRHGLQDWTTAVFFAQYSLCYSDRLLPKSTNVINTILMVRLPVQGWAKSMLNRFGKVWHFHE